MTAALLLSWSIYAAAETYFVGSSPSMPRRISETIFRPLAELMTTATGERFNYGYTGNWPSYVQKMRESKFDLVFEEPHLIIWRVANQDHVPLVKLNGALRFVIIARSDDDTIVQFRDLAGRPVCADAPPAIDGLVLFAQFTNPSRQPTLRRVRRSLDAYSGLLEGRCRGAVLTSNLYQQFSRDSNKTRIVFLSEPFPNWGVSAGRRLPQGLRERIRQVLLDPDNAALTRPLTEVHAGGYELLRADQSDYTGYNNILQGFWGLR